MTGNRRTLPGAERLPLRGYLPLVVAAAVFVAVVVLVPSKTPSSLASSEVAEVEAGLPASGWGETVTACEGQEDQIPGDGYSPPCFAFEGDNGGATARGVTEDEVTVSFRVTPEANFIATFAAVAGLDYQEDNEDLARTAEGLVEYFNANFEMYGRRMVLERVPGTGSVVEEFFGGGQAGANNDALKAADEIQSFADISAFTQPYAAALAREGVVSFGAPYLSREWFEENRPYGWSVFTDCTVIGETGSEYALNRLLDRPAEFAGGELQGQTRRVALIAPDNPEYQQCVGAANDTIEAGGSQLDLVLDYNFNLANLQPQASTVLARLREAGITTVGCTCDPLFLLYLTREAVAEDYQPEWQVFGTGFVDLDLVAQAYNQPLSGDQWSRAFGISYYADQVAFEEGPGYAAYSSVRDDRPSVLVDLLYYQLYSLAIGIQMAGPELTPENFETGMFSYPEGTGTAGTWDWSPGHYTPQVDSREVWFDPDTPSAFNGEPGTYVGSEERYRQGEWPEGDPEVFR